MSFFDVYGYYEIERNQNIIGRSQKSFWYDVDGQDGDLRRAIGCYVFCLKWGDKLTPWYVGKTLAKEGFYGEVFTRHKLEIYNDTVAAKGGVPVMFLLPLMTPGARFSRAYSDGERVIAWMEVTLMGFAFRKNAEIKNIRDMTFLRNVEVLGLMGKRKGRPHTEASLIRKALGS